MTNIFSGIVYLAIFILSALLIKEDDLKSRFLFLGVLFGGILIWAIASTMLPLHYYIYPQYARYIILIAFLLLWTGLGFVWRKTAGITIFGVILFFFTNSSIYLSIMYLLTIFGIIDVL